MTISPAAHAVLQNAWCEGVAVKLPPTPLDRAIYDEVNEVLVRLGGKWKTNRKAHIFDFYDPAPLLAAVQASGLMPPKNPTAFFPTPKPLVADMLRVAEVAGLHSRLTHDRRKARILEPSAGTGAIADAVCVACDAEIDCCEVLDLNRAVLESKGHVVVADDFLSWNPGAVYDAIVMNPPFSLPGDKQAWLTHLLHAWSLLKDGGRLVCIAPAGARFRSDARLEAARDLILQYGGIDDIPAGTFKESGTGVATAFLWMNRTSQAWRDEEYQGWANYHQWLLFLHIDNTRESTDAFQALIDQHAPDNDMLAFLTKIVREVRELGDWICWDEYNQALALAAYHCHFGPQETVNIPQRKQKVVQESLVLV